MTLHISEGDQSILNEIIEKYKSDFEFYAFGSRVTGNHNKYSDLDIAVRSTGKTPIWELKHAFEDSDITITVDVINLENITDNFKQIINNSNIRLEPK